MFRLLRAGRLQVGDAERVLGRIDVESQQPAQPRRGPEYPAMAPV